MSAGWESPDLETGNAAQVPVLPKGFKRENWPMKSLVCLFNVSLTPNKWRWWSRELKQREEEDTRTEETCVCPILFML